ncbi:MAG: tetratricopeptide repeat protein, partial [Myxococcota bacterium]
LRAVDIGTRIRSISAGLLPLFASSRKYSFYEGTGFPGQDKAQSVRVDPISLVAHGVRAYAPLDKVGEVLTRLGDRPLRLIDHDHLRTITPSPHESRVLELLRSGSATVAVCEQLSSRGILEARRFLYLLAVLGLLKPASSSRPPRKRAISSRSNPQMAAVSVRPSVGPGSSPRMPAVSRPPPRTSTNPGRPSIRPSGAPSKPSPTRILDRVRTHFDMGNWAGAAEELEAAIAADASNPDYHAELAFALYQRGEVDADALRTVNEALRLYKRSDRAHTVKALVVERLGYPDRAVAHFRKATQLNPGNRLAVSELARLEGKKTSNSFLGKLFKK